MNKKLLFGMVLILSTVLSGEIFAQAAVSVDPAVYTRRGVTNDMALTCKWLYSNKLNNYSTAADLIGPANYVRGMVVKDGKMLFIDRDKKRITVVNGSTGARETPITLASNLFTFLGRNVANTADSLRVAGTLQYNDIKVDNAGNVLLANLYEASPTNPNQRFQVWKVNLLDGSGVVVVDDNLSRLFPAATSSTLRFDAFGVTGDVNSSAIIMASNAKAMTVFKWKITNGAVVGDPDVIDIDNLLEGTYLTGKGNPGSAPQVFPLDDNFFYLDGNETYPTLIDKDGNIIDGFYNKPSALKDSVTAPAATPKTIWTMNPGHNGLAEFQVGNKYFLVMAATNTAGVPTSTFRLFQFADANKAFSGLTCLWTFPQAGMGGTSNSYRTAMPCVEVNGTKANIYVYTGENGYGMYELDTAAPAGVISPNSSKVQITVFDSFIRLSEEVASVEVFNTTGQKLFSAKNVDVLEAPATKGVYMVTITDRNGEHKVQKVAIN